MAVLPATGWGVVLLTNGSNDLRPTDVDAIAHRVMARLLGLEPEPLPGPVDETYALVLPVMVAAIALQALGVVRSAAPLRRWRVHPPRRPQGAAGVAASGVLAVVWGGLARPALAMVALRRAGAAASSPVAATADPVRPTAR